MISSWGRLSIYLAFFGLFLDPVFPICHFIHPSSSSVFPQVIRPPHLGSSSASFIFPRFPVYTTFIEPSN